MGKGGRLLLSLILYEELGGLFLLQEEGDLLGAGGQPLQHLLVLRELPLLVLLGWWWWVCVRRRTCQPNRKMMMMMILDWSPKASDSGSPVIRNILSLGNVQR